MKKKTPKIPVSLRPAATLPAGFRAAGVVAGLKTTGAPDMAMFFSDVPALLAGTFTQNQVRAAPVKLDAQRLAEYGMAHGVVVNSGQANACTGAQGLRDAKETATTAAAALGIAPEMMLVCSTGVIGKPLDMEKIRGGIARLAPALSAKGGEAAARGIMTTDTRPKCWTATFTVEGKPCRLTGIAKGAGMIEPNMATMLAFLMTDALVDRAAMQKALSAAVATSFNCISIDGDQSTNDTVLMFANGCAGNEKKLHPRHPDWPQFAEALTQVCAKLAEDMVRDGEGAKKLIRLQLEGAKSVVDARAAIRAVGNSMLIKTSWAGTRANWGRIMDALGYSAAKVDESRVDVFYNDLPAVRGGILAGTPDKKLSAILAKNEVTITIHLHLGRHSAKLLTCDCTEEYVTINKT